jgi:hypothetical protein
VRAHRETGEPRLRQELATEAGGAETWAGGHLDSSGVVPGRRASYLKTLTPSGVGTSSRPTFLAGARAARSRPYILATVVTCVNG